MTRALQPDANPLPHREKLLSAGYRLIDLADLMGYSYSHATNVLRGLTPAKPETISLLDELVQHLEQRGGE